MTEHDAVHLDEDAPPDEPVGLHRSTSGDTGPGRARPPRREGRGRAGRRPAVTVACLVGALLIGACTASTDPPDGSGPPRPGLAQFDRDGAAFWDVSFTLPEGATFTTDTAIGVGVSVRDRPGGLLSSVTVNAQAADRAELAEVLARDVAQLGLDAAAVDAFLTGALRPGSNRVFQGRPLGYLSPDVDVRLPSGGGTIALNYHFTWEPGPATPSTGVAAAG